MQLIGPHIMRFSWGDMSCVKALTSHSLMLSESWNSLLSNLQQLTMCKYSPSLMRNFPLGDIATALMAYLLSYNHTANLYQAEKMAMPCEKETILVDRFVRCPKVIFVWCLRGVEPCFCVILESINYCWPVIVTPIFYNWDAEPVWGWAHWWCAYCLSDD